MDRLLDYHMKQTEKRFDELKADIHDQFMLVNTKLEDLTRFKIEMLASARTTSLIVSSLCGLLTMVVTIWSASKGWFK